MHAQNYIKFYKALDIARPIQHNKNQSKEVKRANDKQIKRYSRKLNAQANLINVVAKLITGLALLIGSISALLQIFI